MLKLKNLALAGALLASTALPAFALPITITGEDNLGNTDTATAGSPVNFGPAIVGAWTINGSAQGTPPAMGVIATFSSGRCRKCGRMVGDSRRPW